MRMVLAGIQVVDSALVHDAMKAELKACLCSLVRRKPETTYDNVLKDIGTRYVDGYAAPSFADLLENAPFAE